MRKVAGAVALAAVIGLLGTQLAGCQRSDGGAAPGKAAPVAATPAANGQASAPASDAPPGKHGAGAAHKAGDKPMWRALTPAQQQALQPLQGEWDQMDGVRKQKWLQLADRFSTMKPAEQQRVHERMREWVKLTPEQRELARETYSRTRKIAPADKTATWESYQQLPDEQKKKLAASASRKAHAVVPSQAVGKAVAPLGRGATACPAGMMKNPVSAAPPCVSAPAPAVAPPPPVQQPPAVPPATPTPPPQPEKPQVPANWGITPNNA